MTAAVDDVEGGHRHHELVHRLPGDLGLSLRTGSTRMVVRRFQRSVVG